MVPDGITKTGVPFITAVENGLAGFVGFGTGTKVADGMTRNGVPFISVVEPVTPAGAWATGICVAGMTSCGFPLTIVVAKGLLGFATGAGIVVTPGTMRTGTPFTVAVEPLKPAGAADRGIVVAPGMTRT